MQKRQSDVHETIRRRVYKMDRLNDWKAVGLDKLKVQSALSSPTAGYKISEGKSAK